MPKGDRDSLIQGLATLERRYQTDQALAMDPLSMPRRYQDPADQELSAWVAAHLAYGRVTPMLRAIERILEPLGPHPSRFLRTRAEAPLEKRLRRALEGWVWRFHTSHDLIHWLLAWKRLDQESGGRGLESHLSPVAGEDPSDRLSILIQRLRKELPATNGIRFMLPDPREGAACKRWRLFLRWMTRIEWPDLGIWQTYPLKDLVIPLDTHVARISRYLGFSARKTPDGIMAREITDALARMDPADPLRFDFAISHLGILGDCPVIRQAAACARCPLSSGCKAKP